ncbi:hypothetical protein D3C80_1530990 [compost metagenome]
MPPSRSGRRRVSSNMAKARNRIPTPVMAQPISKAAGLATSAIFCGRLKTPAPSIELSTKAVNAVRPSFLSNDGSRDRINNYAFRAGQP